MEKTKTNKKEEFNFLKKKAPVPPLGSSDSKGVSHSIFPKKPKDQEWNYWYIFSAVFHYLFWLVVLQNKSALMHRWKLGTQQKFLMKSIKVLKIDGKLWMEKNTILLEKTSHIMAKKGMKQMPGQGAWGNNRFIWLIMFMLFIWFIQTGARRA